MNKKEYIMPSLKVVNMTTIHMLTASVETENFSYNRFTLSRESNSGWEDEEEEEDSMWK